MKNPCRRRSPRHHIRGFAAFEHFGAAAQCPLIDLSTGGLKILDADHVAVGTRLQLNLSDSTSQPVLGPLDVRVVRHIHGGFAAEFLGLDLAQQVRLSHAIRTLAVKPRTMRHPGQPTQPARPIPAA